MADSRTLKPFPGYVILEPYEIKKKIAGWELPEDKEGENAPQIGKVIIVGEKATHSSGRMDLYSPAETGDIVAYKRYQDFPILLGTKKYIAVAFENLLFKIEESDE